MTGVSVTVTTGVMLHLPSGGLFFHVAFPQRRPDRSNPIRRQPSATTPWERPPGEQTTREKIRSRFNLKTATDGRTGTQTGNMQPREGAAGKDLKPGILGTLTLAAASRVVVLKKHQHVHHTRGLCTDVEHVEDVPAEPGGTEGCSSNLDQFNRTLAQILPHIPQQGAGLSDNQRQTRIHFLHDEEHLERHRHRAGVQRQQSHAFMQNTKIDPSIDAVSQSKGREPDSRGNCDVVIRGNMLVVFLRWEKNVPADFPVGMRTKPREARRSVPMIQMFRGGRVALNVHVHGPHLAGLVLLHPQLPVFPRIHLLQQLVHRFHHLRAKQQLISGQPSQQTWDQHGRSAGLTLWLNMSVSCRRVVYWRRCCWIHSIRSASSFSSSWRVAAETKTPRGGL